MIRISLFFIPGLIFLIPFLGRAQGSEAAKISFSFSDAANLPDGAPTQLLIHVQPINGWHVYSALPSEEMAYNPTTITYGVDSEGFEAGESLSEKGEMHSEFDEIMNGIMRYYNGEVTFSQGLKITGEKVLVTGTFDYMACNDIKCVMFSEEFNLALKPR